MDSIDRIRELFGEAIALEGNAREEFLRQLTSDDSSTADLVALVAAYENAPASIELPLFEFSGLLNAIPIDTAMEPPDDAWHGRQVGPYRIVRRIASGGMGTVFEAQQDQPKRAVALKVLRRSLMPATELRRFEHEAHALALLQHPNIAQVFGAGTSEIDGVSWPYFALELVDGIPATRYVTEKQLSTRQRLELFIQVAQAVHHAHQKGVIHRDLKPDNILVTADGQSKVVDFGVARVTNADMEVTTLHTNVGQVIGTLAYMSPEQASGNPDEVDIRSDVYALGVNLFEFLVGRVPSDIKGKMIHEAIQEIRELQAPRLGSLDRSFRGDLETIVAKALQNDKEQRYQSALAMVEDLQRFLNDEPIVASTPSRAYRLRKFISRNRIAVSAGVVVFLALVSATGVSLAFAFSEASQRDVAQDNLALAEQRQQETQSAMLQLESIVDFQSSMLSEIDVETLGRNVFANLKQRVRDGLVEDGVSQVQVDASIAAFDKLLGELSPTDVAVQILDDEILAKAEMTIEKQFADQPVQEAALRDALGNTYGELALFEQALTQNTLALAIRRRELGNDHPKTLAALDSVGLTLARMGRHKEALRVHRESLEAHRRVLGNDDVQTLSSIASLSLLYSAMGKNSDALDYCREALKGRRRILGNSHVETLQSMNNLSVLLNAAGKYDEALRYCDEALEGRRRTLGDDQFLTLLCMNQKGSILDSMGRSKEALPYFLESLAGLRRTKGNNHDKTLSAVTNLGALYAEQGEHAEALAYLQEALDGNRRVLGNDHPHTFGAMGNVAYVLSNLQRYDEALSYRLESLAGLRRTVGNDHPSTLTAINNTGVIEDIGRHDEALIFLREALDGDRRLHGDTHPNTLNSLHNLSLVLSSLGKHDEAMACSKEAVDGFRQKFGSDHPQTATALHALAGFLIRNEEYTAAELLCVEAVSAFRHSYPASDYRVGVALTSHGKALTMLNRYEEAEAALEEAQTILEGKIGLTHKRTIKNTELLIDLYDAWHAAAPNADHDARAAYRRQKLLSASAGKSD